MEKGIFYELTYLISPDLNETEAREIQRKAVEEIVSQEGKILITLEPQKIGLCYPVEKKREAYLATIEFELKPQPIVTLQQKIKEMKQIIRFLLIKRRRFAEKKTAVEKPITDELKIKPETEAVKPRPAKKEKAVKTKKEEKVDLDKIEEELEKVLDLQGGDEPKVQ